MRFKHKFCETLNTKGDPLSYASNSVVLDHLENEFIGKCRENFYVESIESFKMGEIVFNRADVDANASFSVEVITICIRYDPGELMMSTVVLNRPALGVLTTMSMDNITYAIVVDPNPDRMKSVIEVISERQHIPIRVLHSNMIRTAEKGTIAVELYIPIYEKINYYRVTSDQPADHSDILNALQSCADDNYSGEAYQNIERMFYNTGEMPNGANPLSIKDIVALRKDNKVIAVPTKTSHKFPAVIMKGNNGDGNVIEGPSGIIISLILANHLQHKQLLRECYHLYNDKDVFESHANLWKVFQQFNK
jgi:hypothetical protein